MIRNFSEFCEELQASGFSMGGKSKGIFALIPYSWEEQELIDLPVKWHTGDPETDPWEWRMRVLEERNDIAYSKVFFRVSGYITKQWYPAFLAVRREGQSFQDAYEDGVLSAAAKRIYSIVETNGRVPLHEIKALGGFGRDENTEFERAMVELQMRLYLTMCGRAQKRNQFGEGYGWSSTVFCTTETFWGEEVFALSHALRKQAAYERIAAQVKHLNPDAAERTIRKFIIG